MNFERTILIAPSSEHYLNNQLFNIENKILNRDGTLLPYLRLKQRADQLGVTIATADHRSLVLEQSGPLREYWSMGHLEDLRKLSAIPGLSLEGFILFEPPIVSPEIYARLPEITHYFKRVYIHNIYGNGYSLREVDQTKLRKLRCPQPYNGPVQPFFDRKKRLKKLVAICGAHNPRFRKPELYSERIKSIAELKKFNAIDLYGRGWDQVFSLKNLWWPYWRNRSSLMQVYRGCCDNKLEVLSRYDFSLCYENTPMSGYLTEKLFDCFYAGCVPVYWGGEDITETIPSGCFISRQDFKNERELFDYIAGIKDSELESYRECIRNFLNSEMMLGFLNFLEDEILIAPQ